MGLETKLGRVIFDLFDVLKSDVSSEVFAAAAREEFNMDNDQVASLLRVVNAAIDKNRDKSVSQVIKVIS